MTAEPHGEKMIKPLIAAIILIITGTASFAQSGLSLSCPMLTSTYLSQELREPIVDVNSTNLAPADFYDNVACECRLNQQQTIGQATLKAISAINAGLWAAEPMHHDLSAQEQREANAFDSWMAGRGKRPTMHGISACTYSRTNQ
jgi:hypothetical protein